jgi:hypothetical protein
LSFITSDGRAMSLVSDMGLSSSDQAG